MQRGTGYEGFSIELWQSIAAINGWKTEFVWHKTVKEVLASVEARRVEVGIAGISMTQEREKVVDFSYPMFNSGLQIMTSTRSSGLGWREYLSSVFSSGLVRIILAIFAVIVLAAHAIWLIERRRDPTYPKDYLRGVGEGIWRAGINLATGGFGDRVPQTVLGRLIALGWVFLGIILLANFTAAVTSNLTLQNLKSSVSGLSDLPGKRVYAVANTTSAQYLSDLRLRFKTVEKIEDGYELLLQSQADALVFDAPVLQYHASHLGKGRMRVVGPIFKQEFYGIALPTGSTLREPINRALLDLITSGRYQQIYERYFGGT
jgi:ABC-type amino acid transport substrate-binding protein